MNEGDALRSKLGAFLGLIRFATMSAEEFAEFVGNKSIKILFIFGQLLISSVPSGVLNADEKLDILMMINGQKPVGQPICKINFPRRGIHNIMTCIIYFSLKCSKR